MKEGLSGRVKKIVQAVGLAAGLAVPGEVYTQQVKAPKPEVKNTPVQVEKIDESKLTESGKIFRDIIKAMREDLKKVKTQEDANWLLRSDFGAFISEYYIPTKGDIKEGPYAGIKIRDYSQDDLKFILQGAREMKKILLDLNAKFQVEGFERRMEQIDDLIKKVEERSSLAGQKRHELLNQYK